MVKLDCKHCGSAYERFPAAAKKSKYCSQRCHNTAISRTAGIQRHRAAIAARTTADQPVDHRIVILKDGAVVRVDTEDYDLALREPWFHHTQGYAAVPSRYLHRLVLGRMLGRPLTSKDVVDHINHDKLDNRRSNLRLATVSLNGANMKLPSHNTSGYKGVRWVKQGGGCWYSSVKHKQRQVFLGLFDDVEQAALAYDAAAVQLFGEFARTNLL